VSENLSKALAELAQKLGTTSEHLWGVLVRQAFIDGFSSLLSLLFCLLLAVVAVASFFYLQRKYRGLTQEQVRIRRSIDADRIARTAQLGNDQMEVPANADHVAKRSNLS